MKIFQRLFSGNENRACHTVSFGKDSDYLKVTPLTLLHFSVKLCNIWSNDVLPEELCCEKIYVTLIKFSKNC